VYKVYRSIIQKEEQGFLVLEGGRSVNDIIQTQYEKFHNLNTLPSMIRIARSRSMGWVLHVARMW
jgi:hypothetical protein